MRKSVGVVLLILMSLSFAFAAEACDLDISLVNQDPYPAVQDDYVKLVFQIDGISSSDCGTVRFELLEKYPIAFDQGQQKEYVIESGTYTKDFQDFFMVTYKVRVDADAIDGENPIEVRYSYGLGTTETEEFNLEVQDVRAEFEIFVSNYDNANNELSIEILNIGAHDVEALTMEIPDQDGAVVKGSKIKIIGDIDSNEDSSADFEATLEDGEYKVVLKYSDEIGERRVVEKTFAFESEDFMNRAGEEKGNNSVGWIITVIVIAAGIIIYRRKKKNKK